MLSTDSLDIRNAVLGDGLVLNRMSDGGVVIHSVSGGSARELGCFNRAVDAWKAIDALDSASLDMRIAA